MFFVFKKNELSFYRRKKIIFLFMPETTEDDKVPVIGNMPSYSIYHTNQKKKDY